MDTEVVRSILGGVCFVVAGAQLVMRYMIADYFDDHERRRSAQKERTLSTALLFLLTGIGLGNLTHLSASLTFSTLLVSLGVCWSAWAIVDLWRWGQEEVEKAENGQNGQHKEES